MQQRQSQTGQSEPPGPEDPAAAAAPPAASAEPALGVALDPNDPDIQRVESAYALVSQEGMTPELAVQILSLADNTPDQVRQAVASLGARAAQIRAVADTRLAEERAVHDDITAQLAAAAREEAADYTSLRDEQDRLLEAARGLNEQVGRIVAFFGLPVLPAPGAPPAPPPQEEEEEGRLGRLFSIFVERRDDEDEAQTAQADKPVTGDEPPIYDPEDDVVRKVKILAGLIALPNKTAEQVLTMVKPQGIDLQAIGAIVARAHDIAGRQITQSEAIKALVEARHQEEVGRLGAASNKENTQFDAVVREHAAVTAQLADLERKMAHLRQFFGFAG
jgi:hypothetical protein